MSIEKLPYDKEEEELVKKDVERELFHVIRREQAKDMRRVEMYLYGEEDRDILDFLNEEIGEPIDELDGFIEEEELYESLEKINPKIEEGFI